MVLSLHVDLISCQYLSFYTSVALVQLVDMLECKTFCGLEQADGKCLVSITCAVFGENDQLTNYKIETFVWP